MPQRLIGFDDKNRIKTTAQDLDWVVYRILTDIVTTEGREGDKG
jgi:hypothetical protein